MISEPNIKEVLMTLSNIEAQIDSISQIPTQTSTPVTFYKPLPFDVQTELDQAEACVKKASRLLMGPDTTS